eukprot:TRINITY_DN370_c0_g1_i1.p1 TRINITY_DN370_c0_g1~~TRINITY_DN370_c0_g1_i1.p1  ORF type:complete len:290 (+),score=70.84 TRINITY_DN370_c0_g1_i1:108-872(+)
MWLKPSRELTQEERTSPLLAVADYRLMMSLLGVLSTVVVMYCSYLTERNVPSEKHVWEMCTIPSVSKAVGSSLPQKWYFRFLMVAISLPILLSAIAQRSFFLLKVGTTRMKEVLVRLLYWFQTTETVSLFAYAFILPDKSESEYLHFLSLFFFIVFGTIKLGLEAYFCSHEAVKAEAAVSWAFPLRSITFLVRVYTVFSLLSMNDCADRNIIEALFAFTFLVGMVSVPLSLPAGTRFTILDRPAERTRSVAPSH